MYKFRSMRVNDTEKTGWSSENDPRITRFGAFIRKFALDELPQFFNVLKGDMSLVGPRPEVPFYVEKFKKEIPLYMLKHSLRPGITGLAQIKGLRDAGCTGGYMTWNAGASIDKYTSLIPAFAPPESETE